MNQLATFLKKLWLCHLRRRLMLLAFLIVGIIVYVQTKEPMRWWLTALAAGYAFYKLLRWAADSMDKDMEGY